MKNNMTGDDNENIFITNHNSNENIPQSTHQQEKIDETQEKNKHDIIANIENPKNSKSNNYQKLRVLIKIKPSSLENDKPSIILQKNSNDQILKIKKDDLLFESNYEKVFGINSNQKELFRHIKPSIERSIHSINSTIISFGQLNSGKTYTLYGKDWTYEKSNTSNSSRFNDFIVNPFSEFNGIIPRTINFLFEELEIFNLKKKEFFLSCSYLEIFNEKVFDLLDEKQDFHKELDILEDETNGFFAPHLLEYSVESVYDCINLLKKGENRMRERTKKKLNSKRSSHTIFEIKIERQLSGQKTKKNKISFCEVASKNLSLNSEREITQEELNQVLINNLSLNTLNDVIKSLSEGDNFIPYKESVLTKLLQDSLGGKTQTILITHISPMSEYVNETLDCLKFSDLAKNIFTKIKIKLNSSDDQKIIANLKAEIHNFRKNISPIDKSLDLKVIESELEVLRKENQELKKFSNSNYDIKELIEENHRLRAKLGRYEELRQTAGIKEIIQEETNSGKFENSYEKISLENYSKIKKNVFQSPNKHFQDNNKGEFNITPIDINENNIKSKKGKKADKKTNKEFEIQPYRKKIINGPKKESYLPPILNHAKLESEIPSESYAQYPKDLRSKSNTQINTVQISEKNEIKKATSRLRILERIEAESGLNLKKDIENVLVEKEKLKIIQIKRESDRLKSQMKIENSMNKISYFYKKSENDIFLPKFDQIYKDKINKKLAMINQNQKYYVKKQIPTLNSKDKIAHRKLLESDEKNLNNNENKLKYSFIDSMTDDQLIQKLGQNKFKNQNNDIPLNNYKNEFAKQDESQNNPISGVGNTNTQFDENNNIDELVIPETEENKITNEHKTIPEIKNNKPFELDKFKKIEKVETSKNEPIIENPKKQDIIEFKKKPFEKPNISYNNNNQNPINLKTNNFDKNVPASLMEENNVNQNLSKNTENSGNINKVNNANLYASHQNTQPDKNNANQVKNNIKPFQVLSNPNQINQNKNFLNNNKQSNTKELKEHDEIYNQTKLDKKIDGVSPVVNQFGKSSEISKKINDKQEVKGNFSSDNINEKKPINQIEEIPYSNKAAEYGTQVDEFSNINEEVKEIQTNDLLDNFKKTDEVKSNTIKEKSPDITEIKEIENEDPKINEENNKIIGIKGFENKAPEVKIIKSEIPGIEETNEKVKVDEFKGKVNTEPEIEVVEVKINQTKEIENKVSEIKEEVGDITELNNNKNNSKIKEANDDVPEIKEANDDVPEIKEINDDALEIKEINDDVPEIKEINDDALEIKEVNDDALEIKEVNDDVAEIKEINDDVPEIKEINDDVPEIKEINDDAPEIKEINDDVPEIKEINDDAPEIKEINDEVPVLNENKEVIEKQGLNFIEVSKETQKPKEIANTLEKIQSNNNKEKNVTENKNSDEIETQKVNNQIKEQIEEGSDQQNNIINNYDDEIILKNSSQKIEVTQADISEIKQIQNTKNHETTLNDSKKHEKINDIDYSSEKKDSVNNIDKIKSPSEKKKSKKLSK